MYRIVDDRRKSSVNSYDSINELVDRIDIPDDQKICSAYGTGNPVDWRSMRRKIQNPKYVCRSCGRSTSESSSLCSPEKL
jgi:hypothetical protein